MSTITPFQSQREAGELVNNIMHFGRLLRATGLRVGTGHIVDAIKAVTQAGVESRDQLYWALHCALVKRRSEQEIFDQAFAVFWRDPSFLKRMMSLMIPQTTAPPSLQQREMMRRLSDALAAAAANSPKESPQEVEVDAFETYSPAAIDRTKDFAQMTAEELIAVRLEIQKIDLLQHKRMTRRFTASGRGDQIDLKRILRESATRGSDHLLLHYRKRRRRRTPLVILCDISGSMEQYARVLLHFIYAVQSDHDRVSCFLFATRLHNVTRKLKSRDPDLAISAIGKEVADWSGGTRIGECLREFNKNWARRVLSGNAHVLLFTDGLDREGGEGMGQQARRLAASCRRLVWVNPLLRYDRYEPTAAGAQILNHHASELRSCHNVNSLADLAKAMSTG